MEFYISLSRSKPFPTPPESTRAVRQRWAEEQVVISRAVTLMWLLALVGPRLRLGILQHRDEVSGSPDYLSRHAEAEIEVSSNSADGVLCG